MDILVAIILCVVQAESAQREWKCLENTSVSPSKQIARLSAREMIDHVLTCKTPRLPGNVDAKGTVVIEVLVDATGGVACLRAISGHPIIREAALEAARSWKFKPRILDGTSAPYSGLIAVYVSWDVEEMEKHCPARAKPNSGVQSARATVPGESMATSRAPLAPGDGLGRLLPS